MFEAILKKMQHFLSDEDGPTAVEYAVLLMLILLICLTSIQMVSKSASDRWAESAEQIAKMGSG